METLKIAIFSILVVRVQSTNSWLNYKMISSTCMCLFEQLTIIFPCRLSDFTIMIGIYNKILFLLKHFNSRLTMIHIDVKNWMTLVQISETNIVMEQSRVHIHQMAIATRNYIWETSRSFVHTWILNKFSTYLHSWRTHRILTIKCPEHALWNWTKLTAYPVTLNTTSMTRYVYSICTKNTCPRLHSTN